MLLSILNPVSFVELSYHAKENILVSEIAKPMRLVGGFRKYNTPCCCLNIIPLVPTTHPVFSFAKEPCQKTNS